ncbi:MAG: hypothetical protein HLUCCA05_05420 [Roseibaca calidilacus]|uniref:Uncharacterized protein n=1 Tax=Roseibaca calidilacus TaxID=1666912 RepID=A0A0P7WTU6_9RHOB|nr:hypothetical protein [Roseibaca calidilacus]KPP90854.1 MAG: hypothetical protein HLUCCA05_05420 [Roseibaca calidilacus]CUX83679.1 hypothetical protein Ga0058931_3124 [Roseibaca calidilacus]
MDTGIIFLLGVYLVPLALVSAVGAWADGRKPYVALGLGAVGVGLAVLASVLRPDGRYGLRDIPELSAALIVRLWQAF